MKLFLALSLLAIAPITTKNDDAKKIQGTWVMVSKEEDGRKRTVAGELKYTIGPDRISNANLKEAGDQYKLDADKKPKTIDLVPGDGPEKGKTVKGLYELDGDTLRICLATQATMPRPTEFASSKGVQILVLKRIK